MNAKTFITIICITLLLACNNNAHKIAEIPQQIDIPSTVEPVSDKLTEREKLVQALKTLEVAFKQKNTDEIAQYFKFPLNEETMPVFGEIDNLFDAEYERNGHLITKNMFYQHFDSLYEYFDMSGFERLFQNLSLNHLLDKDEINCEKHYKDSGCYYIYEIRIDGNEITLQYGTNSEPNYVNPDYEDGEWCSEYAYFWTFAFDGQKLYLAKYAMAG